MRWYVKRKEEVTDQSASLRSRQQAHGAEPAPCRMRAGDLSHRYSHEQESGVPESIDVALHLYWCAMSNNSAVLGEVLTDLLRSRGIE